MDARLGNQNWRFRSRHGPKPQFETPEALWDACVEYFDWVEQNPLYEDKLVVWQGEAKHEPVAKMRAMTNSGLCIFLDINRSTWLRYRSRDGYDEVCNKVDEIIRTQKFEGAAAELLSPHIIARDLGLADKQEHTGTDGGPIKYSDMSEADIDRRVEELLRKESE